MKDNPNVMLIMSLAMLSHSRCRLFGDRISHEVRLRLPSAIREIVDVTIGTINIAAARNFPEKCVERNQGLSLWSDVIIAPPIVIKRD
jgi:hypothetical protein